MTQGRQSATQLGKHNTVLLGKQTKTIGILLFATGRMNFSLYHQAPSLEPKQGESTVQFPGFRPAGREASRAEPVSSATGGGFAAAQLPSRPASGVGTAPSLPHARNAQPAVASRLPHRQLASPRRAPPGPTLAQHRPGPSLGHGAPGHWRLSRPPPPARPLRPHHGDRGRAGGEGSGARPLRRP